MPFVKHDDDGKGEGSRLSRFFRKGDKKSDGGSVGVPMHISTKSLILDESKESRSSRRTDLNRAKTEHHLLTSKRNNRALSPTTKRRIERSLGIGDISVISAPTVLNYDDADVSQAHSNPPAKRHSLESDARGLLVSRRNQSTRSMRRLHSSAPSVSQLAFEKKTVNSNLESVEKGRVEESTALQSVATAQLVSNRKTDTLKANIKIPKGVVSIVITDIEGSTMMWEQNPSAMKDALNVHDSIIRRCYVKQSGYEIATEGDSFRLAFHHPLDALSFCLDCQTKLFNANWTNGILELQNAKHIPDRQMRGLRVRMVVHHGQTTSRTHETTHRIFFKGEGVDIAKALEKVSHGGQIVTNVETWKEVSGLAERHLGSPQILDLGKHDLKGKGNVIHTQRLLQLVPKRLAFDYCTFRGTVEQFTRPEGRTFPPPKTYRQLSTSFFTHLT